MRRSVASMVVMSAFTAAAPAISAAAPSPAAEAEIAHLLAFIGSSGCTFLRNGSEAAADQAQQHIAMKYGNIRKRVATTEDFIRYAATESSMSGKPYKVRCKGVEQPSAAWLKTELARYRAAAK